MSNRKSMREGAVVKLPCEVKTGFFPDEAIVTISIDSARVIIGHVSLSSIIQRGENRFISGIIMSSPGNGNARIFLPGEIVSEMNPVTVPVGWLNKFF